MSRYSAVVILFFLIFFGGCSIKSPQTPSFGPGEKAFEKEDEYILKALDLQRRTKSAEAASVYEELYGKSGKLEYLLESLKIFMLQKDYEKMKESVDMGLKKYPKNESLRRFLIGYWIEKKDYKKSEELILDLLKDRKNLKNYEIAASVYIIQKKFDLALKYYQSGYKIDNNPRLLDKIVYILYYHLDRKEEAIAYLETHIRMNECSMQLCYRLIELYGKEKDIDGLVSTYKKLYFKFKDEKYAKKVVELLSYRGNKKGAISFLKKTEYNDDLLMDIYVSAKDYENAFITASKIYKVTKNPLYLGKMAIFEYEKSKNKDKKTLMSVAKKFEESVHKIGDPLYYNYYGYLLIDHDMDIKKGIEFVKKALTYEPESPYYLDSLAWGHYKMRDCEKALEIMKEVLKTLKDQEVLNHYKLIEDCAKQGNK